MATAAKPGQKRALLIGSRTGGLRAVRNDLSSMEAILLKYDFNITRCAKPDATRQGILTAFQTLLTTTGKDDSIVIYYTGHGGMTERAISIRKHDEPWRLQYLVPRDMKMSKPGDFRGILDVELSHYLKELTKICENVTIILDCCHSSRMARGSHVDRDETVKALPPAFYDQAVSHLRSLQGDGQLDTDDPYLEGNVNVVRISAAAANEEAWEYTDSCGRRISALTQVLAEILDDAYRKDISWQSISLRLRDRMALTMQKQHPEIAGPVARLLFSLEERQASFHMVKFSSAGPPALQAGRLHGVEEDDVFALLPYGAEKLDLEKKIATATIHRVMALESEMSIDKTPLLADNVVAFLESKALKRWPVTVTGPVAFRDFLTKYLEKFSPSLRVSDEGEVSIAAVNFDGDNISVWDDSGVQVGRWPYRMEGGVNEHTAKMLDRLVVLSGIQNLSKMEAPKEIGALESALELGFGMVENGTRRMLDQDDLVMHEGGRMFLSIKNNSDKTLYAHLFEACAGELGLHSKQTVMGRELRANGGDHIWGGDKGWEMPWPTHVGPEATCLNDTFIVIVTDTPFDLSCLDMQHLSSRIREQGKGYAALVDTLKHFGFGYDRMRLAKAEKEEISRSQYDIHHIHVKLLKKDSEVRGETKKLDKDPSEDVSD